MKNFRKFSSICILCGEGQVPNKGLVNRESDRCSKCDSTWRIRAISKSVCMALGLSDCDPFEIKPDLNIYAIGISDSKHVEVFMTNNFNYTNTFIDRFPILDLKQVPDFLNSKFDLITCSDVLEHVSDPVDLALQGMYNLLKPGGSAVISVPLVRVKQRAFYSFDPKIDRVNKATIEYYPGITDYKFSDDESELFWSSGDTQFIDKNPEIHGGEGIVLTFRLWGIEDLIDRLMEIGFHNVMQPKDLVNERILNAEDAGILIATK